MWFKAQSLGNFKTGPSMILLGNLGILIINILILVFAWSVVIYSIIKGPLA